MYTFFAPKTCEAESIVKRAAPVRSQFHMWSMKCGVPFSFLRFVRISQPDSVTSRVCSNWAENKPSAVTAVQSSGQETSRQVPSDIMGSIVKQCPGFITPTAEFSTSRGNQTTLIDVSDGIEKFYIVCKYLLA